VRHVAGTGVSCLRKQGSVESQQFRAGPLIEMLKPNGTNAADHLEYGKLVRKCKWPKPGWICELPRSIPVLRPCNRTGLVQMQTSEAKENQLACYTSCQFRALQETWARMLLMQRVRTCRRMTAWSELNRAKHRIITAKSRSIQASSTTVVPLPLKV
jgi:hypothetical protein